MARWGRGGGGAWLCESPPSAPIWVAYHNECEVLSVVPRSSGNPLMDLTPVPDNNA